MTASPALPDPLGTARRRLTGAERREEFLDAAAQLVLEIGAHAVTMNAVAVRTGVAKRLGYRYFANRGELLKALIDRELAEVGRRAGAALPVDASLETVIEANARVWLQLYQERGPLLERLLFGQDVVRSVTIEINNRATRNWAKTLASSANLTPETAEILASILLTGLRGAVDSLERGLGSAERIAEIYAVMAAAGTRAAAVSP